MYVDNFLEEFSLSQHCAIAYHMDKKIHHFSLSTIMIYLTLCKREIKTNKQLHWRNLSHINKAV